MKKIDIHKYISKAQKNNEATHSPETNPGLKGSEAYKALVRFFQDAQYKIKEGNKPKLVIKHDDFSTIKIKDQDNNYFNKFGLIFPDDSLEAKIQLDIPNFDKEFKIVARRKNNSNRYTCMILSYDNEVIYNKN